eukprot:TRINITY_DN2035_c0_g4_i2.p1 TRINITY_DN2035_c0_g4~~TRINITY_DN2035_c0_g4_i2.p1  ORF type:complete len:503 (-),score=75.14 TRINITY_DN2035_c0_g4_i2:312-1820(-)
MMNMASMTSLKRHGSNLSDDYIKGDDVDFAFGTPRTRVRIMLDHVMADIVLGLVIFFNFIIICIDIDHRARNLATPLWINASMFGCFAVYCSEWCARFYAERFDVFSKSSSNLDLTIIIVGIIEYILGATLDTTEGNQTSEMIRILRMLRLLRLLRVVKLFNALRELRKLMQMMASCAKTMFWSFALCFILMTIWAAIAVQTLDEVVRHVDAEGGYTDCDRCAEAFASVMAANLTLFQIIMAGDSWGRIAIPTIERYPASALIFVGALVTLLFGVLNLVLAVVVDSFAETRRNDMSMLATDLELYEQSEKIQLEQLFNRIDVDGDGAVSFDELHDGARQIEEFRQWLRVLDIDSNDLRSLYDILDEARSGCVSSEEFITVMYRLKNTESKTAVRLMKCLVHTIDDKIANIQKDLDSLLSDAQTDQPAAVNIGDSVEKMRELHSEASTSVARSRVCGDLNSSKKHGFSASSSPSPPEPSSADDCFDGPVFMSEPAPSTGLVDL